MEHSGKTRDIDVSECLVVYESYESACLLVLLVRVSSSLRELLVRVSTRATSLQALRVRVVSSCCTRKPPG